MKVTIIVCTYNRRERLEKVLTSLGSLDASICVGWDVVIVDNNSTDDSRDLILEFCERHPGRFRYVFEPQQGKSHALNAGIREATGDILAFTDDDVVLEANWLDQLTRSLCDGNWAGAGGRVLPLFHCLPPRWLPVNERYGLAPFAMFDRGQTPCELAEPPFGANMAFRKSIFEKYGGFRTDLGPRPGSEIRNEDTEFGARILAAGERLRYEPGAVVYHPVSQERLRKEYFLAWWFGKGRADVRQFGVRGSRWCCFGVPLFLFRKLVVWTIRWIVAIDPQLRFSNKTKIWGTLGKIIEYSSAR